MQKSSLLSIDLETIYQNLDLVAHTGHIMVMVKGNAYGTDPVALSLFLQEHYFKKERRIAFLGVSHVAEGVQLREAGIHVPIFVISAPPNSADAVVQYRLTPAIHSEEELFALNAAARKEHVKLPIHLACNSGMNRFGVSAKEGLQLIKALQSAHFLELEGAMTHFAAAEDPIFDSFTLEQISRFKTFVDSLPFRPLWVHAANSAGAVRFSLPFCNLSRIGLGFLGYGICMQNAKPALQLTTSLCAIRRCQSGDTIGYHRTFRVPKDCLIGIIPFGYYDGYPRSITGKGYTLIRGKKASIVGSICMDFTMIDLSNIPNPKVEEPVILFGEELPLENLALWAETDIREILVRISPRVERVWKTQQSQDSNGIRITKSLSNSFLSF